ncbi:hypothetical protein F5Y00DRAFT_273445 [Daldinia vernicosa]|uniref:uncharacterized protein n=1 Tax=Daldinia vernicosa TaxID=114800 RepID=UPI00200754B1|nr:uncharacterized protein F5Y00DRAFT_273445 [Daldinia vernicosa]KAI0844965.1 hypothetical protein F5Y00DRAFT_273445 [Daldinia vernicosa]
MGAAPSSTRSSAQSSSLSLVQASARDRAFAVTEILEIIFLHIDSRELFLNVQRVCKEWRATIAGSLKILTALFFRSSPKSLNWERYTKNHYVAYLWPKLFNATLFHWGSYPNHTKYSYMSLDEIRSTLDYGMREIWLANNVSWREMLVSQPPITKIHWQVWREDEEDLREPLPGTIAEFNFPTGLRMGTYYDLILGTRGDHEITWPTLTPGHHGRRDLGQWEREQARWAFEQGAILIQQRVHEEPLRLTFLRDTFWDPKYLHYYYRNLTALRRREVKIVGGGVTSEYKTSGTDQASAMEIFLRYAQDPVTPMAY